MMNVGRVCVKLAGRDAGQKCVIVDEIDSVHVLIDGFTRRRKCNKAHLEPTKDVLKIKKGASNADVIKAFKTELKLDIPKKGAAKTPGAKPKKARKGADKVKQEKPKKEEKTQVAPKAEEKKAAKKKTVKKKAVKK